MALNDDDITTTPPGPGPGPANGGCRVRPRTTAAPNGGATMDEGTADGGANIEAEDGGDDGAARMRAPTTAAQHPATDGARRRREQMTAAAAARGEASLRRCVPSPPGASWPAALQGSRALAVAPPR